MDTLVQDRIVLDPAILAGKPVIRGTRLSVEFVIGLLADGWTEQEIFGNYPGISADDIRACLAYARDMLKGLSFVQLKRRSASMTRTLPKDDVHKRPETHGIVSDM
ncbi:MAG: DUF433 domain-containing protein [Rhodospirillales bacterium]|nr:DUF433 domain-containing protein [Rhodospirillales bacterium]